MFFNSLQQQHMFHQLYSEQAKQWLVFIVKQHTSKLNKSSTEASSK